MYKRGMLALGQRQVELIHNTLVADGGEQAQADIADTVFAVQHGRNRHVGIDAGEDALYDMADGNGNRIERCALALDDVAAGLAHVILNVRIVERRNQHAVGVFHSLLVCVCRNVGDVRNGPRHEGAVAMLAQNVSVYVLLVDLVVLGETCTQTVGEALTEKIATIGENMNIRRFVRFEGINQAYIHAGGRIGVLVNFEVADAAKANEDAFKTMAKDVAMQIAAVMPQYVRDDEVPADVVEHEKEILKAQALNEGKPEAIVEKMVVGRIKKFFKDVCLVDQPFVKDQEITVGKYVENVAKELGTDIRIVKFARLEKGEGLEKKEENFADEVAKMMGK